MERILNLKFCNSREVKVIQYLTGGVERGVNTLFNTLMIVLIKSIAICMVAKFLCLPKYFLVG